jgi:hypothetical protein
MFNKQYQIILLTYPEGETITDYYSTIIPMVNDVIIDDYEEEPTEYLVVERHFSMHSQKVILLVEKIKEIE